MPMTWDAMVTQAQQHVDAAKRQTGYRGGDPVVDQGVLALALLQLLTERVEQLEAQPFTYAGPHEVGKAYGPRTFVSHNGSVWYAREATTARPGDGPAWQLAVKGTR